MNIKSTCRVTAALTCAALFFATVPVWAQPVLNPDNGHYYEVIQEGGDAESILGWNWQQAADAAAAMSFSGFNGHLVTITSQEENDFLEDELNIPQNAWIGGMQDPAGSEPAGGWGWITGEAWSFTSWGPNEPNDAGGEDCLQWWSPDGTWNDRGCEEMFSAFVVEFGDENAQPRATFLVSKDFNDGNTAEVEVTLSCNTGLPLQQTTMISDGDPVNFVVKDFEDGAMECEVTEEAVDGYSANYFNGDSNSSVSCVFEEVNWGQASSCVIDNDLQRSNVEVTKVWIDENPQFNAQNVASARWSCTGVPFGSTSGYLNFSGNPDTRKFSVYADWDSGTTCNITEVDLTESGVEVDDSDCQGIVLFPGVDGSCTIFNTRLYEGIPTLSQYGLALMALLMLGVGLIGFRRFV